ncbi:hypothetical protein CKAH01_15746 [Colletotrichum kahawae]|uniref:Uncharacterized protein n=1 Tax=Colletotrichum kahawae TaxID=34407 RepID=A0AAD9YFW6_COLKA|nr:hypothetical protein CKAH01_15746 [Colletotrichum kahawae]
MFMLIFFVLAYHNWRPEPSFASIISINALVAVLATILRAGVLFVMFEVIGQSKWLWMSDPQSLRHVERLVNAGSGPWGSLMFLFHSINTKPRRLTFFSMFVVMAASVIGPFTQQASGTFSCSVMVNGTAKVFVAHNFSGKITPETRAAAIYGLTQRGQGSFRTSQLFECPSITGAPNCTFGTHSSIGMCSGCFDATAHLKEVDLGDATSYHFAENTNFSISWPPTELRNRTLVNVQAEFSPFQDQAALKAGFFESLIGESMSISIIALSMDGCIYGENATRFRRPRCVKDPKVTDISSSFSSTAAGIVAANCTIYPCLREYYSATVTNGIFSQIVRSQLPLAFGTRSLSKSELPTLKQDAGYIRMVEPCLIDHTHGSSMIYDSTNITKAFRLPIKEGGNRTSWIVNEKLVEIPLKCLRSIGPSTYGTMQHLARSALVGSCSSKEENDPSDPMALFSSTECSDKWWLDTILNGGNATISSVSAALDGMVHSITDFIRINGTDWNRTSPGYVTGEGIEPAVCIEVFWRWMLFPFVILVVTTVLLIYACSESIYHRRDVPIWKSTILPFLFYEIRKEEPSINSNGTRSEERLPLLQLAELERLANRTVARFGSTADSPAFLVRHGYLSWGTRKKSRGWIRTRP